MIRAKKIIADSIKDNLIPHVSSLGIPKEMFEALTRLFEGKNINRKMTLRTQLKNVKMQKSKTIHSYFTRVSQINGQIEATGDKVESTELVMTIVNVLPRSWDPCIKGLCSRKKLPIFSRVWEECAQEEARLEASEEKLSDNEYQALATNVEKKKAKENFDPRRKTILPRGPRSFGSLRRTRRTPPTSSVTVVRRLDIT